jgi:hypothetical protein
MMTSTKTGGEEECNSTNDKRIRMPESEEERGESDRVEGWGKLIV